MASIPPAGTSRRHQRLLLIGILALFVTVVGSVVARAVVSQRRDAADARARQAAKVDPVPSERTGAFPPNLPWDPRAGFPHTSTASAPQLTLATQSGGASLDVVTDGRYAYLGVGPRVEVVDVADPRAPRFVGRSEILPGVVRGLALDDEGDRLYVAAGQGGLRVLDVADPAAPREVGSQELPGFATDVVLAGAHAFVAVRDADPGATEWFAGEEDKGGDLVTVDLADPADPRNPKTIGLPEAARRLAFEDGRVYAACGQAGFFIFDVAEPYAPRQLGSWDDAGDVTDVVVRGSYAYLGKDYRPRVIDVSDPTDPREVDTFDDSASEHLAIDGDYLYASLNAVGSAPNAEGRYQSQSGIEVFDLSDPAGPKSIGWAVSPAGDVAAIAARDGRVFGALDGSGGMHVFDTHDVRGTHQPMLAGRYDALGDVWTLAANAGNVFALVFLEDTVHVFGTETPASLVPLSTITDTWAHAAAAQDDRLYLAGTDSRLHIFDLRDPSTPKKLGSSSADGPYISRLAVAGDRVFTTESSGSFGAPGAGVIDVSDPTNPRRLGQTQLTQNPFDLAVTPDGRTVFVAEISGSSDVIATGGPGAVEVLDASDPSRLAPIAFLAMPLDALGIAVDGRHAYVAAQSAGLRVVDIADPTHPREIAALDMPDQARDVVVADGFAYIGYAGGIAVADVREPARPVAVAELPLPGVIREMAIDPAAAAGSDAVLWLAAGEAGIIGVRVDRP